MRDPHKVTNPSPPGPPAPCRPTDTPGTTFPMGPRGGSGSGVPPARHEGRAMAADGGGGRELLALIHQHLLRGGFARAARELQAQSGQVTGGRPGRGAGSGGAVPERGLRRGRRARSRSAPSPTTGAPRGCRERRGPWLHAGPTWCPAPGMLPVPAGRPSPEPPGRASRTAGLVLPERVLLRERSPGKHAALGAAGRGVGGIRREVCAGRDGPVFLGRFGWAPAVAASVWWAHLKSGHIWAGV